MPNTITQRTVSGSGSDSLIVRTVNIVSDGSEETALIVYDNSTLMNNVTKGRLVKVQASGSSCQCQLLWDQTTDSPIVNLDPAYTQEICWESFGGITNPNGTGATGDILLTTTNLDSGDVVTLILYVRQG